MTRNCILLLFLCFNILTASNAQEIKNKLRVQSISSVALLNGSNGSSLALQTIIGVTYKKSFVGFGAGLDYYRYRTIPVFFDLRHEFGKGKNNENMFLYGDIGYNYNWLVDKKMEMNYPYSLDQRFSGGLYYDAGVGYKFGIGKYHALLFSGGYSLKRLKSETGSGICPVIGPCGNEVETYHYYLSRLVLKAGWRF